MKERETETTPVSRKSPVMDVSRQARAAWVSTNTQNSKTGAVWVSTSPQNSTTGAAQVSTSPRNGKARVVWVSSSTQNSKTGAARVSYEAVGAAKRTGGADATATLGRVVGTCPAITPWIHHPACPLPLRPIGHWHRVDEVSHSPGMHTPFTPHGAARSCSRRVEVLRLARLLDTPAGSLRLTHRKTGGVFAPAGSDPYTW